MGSKQSQSAHPLHISEEWVVYDEHSLPKLFTNPQNLIAEEHFFNVDPNLNLDNEMEIYSYRNHQRMNLVRVYGVTNNAVAGNCCSTRNFIRVLVEHLPWRLSEVQAYTFEEGLYVLMQAIPIAKEITKRLGAIRFEAGMFGVTEEGFIRVWVNQNFEHNHPSTANLLSGPKEVVEKDMVKSLLHVVESHLVGQQFPEEFMRQLHMVEFMCFRNLTTMVDKFLYANRIVIPDRLRVRAAGGGEVVGLIPVGVVQPFGAVASNTSVIYNTSLLNPVEFLQETPLSPNTNMVTTKESFKVTRTIPTNVPEMRTITNVPTFETVLRETYLPPPRTSSIIAIQPPTEYFRRMESVTLSGSNQLVKNKLDMASMITTDATIPNTSKLRSNDLVTETVLFPERPRPLGPAFDLQTSVQRTFLPPVIPQSEYINFYDETTMPRVSNPYPLPQYLPAPSIDNMAYTQRNAIHTTEQKYTTPSPPVLISKPLLEEDTFLTTTTYKLDSHVSFQYRTTHPSSVKILPLPEYNPQITVVKLPRIMPINVPRRFESI